MAFAKNGIKAELLQPPATHLDSTPEMATILPINAQRILGELQSYDYLLKSANTIKSLGVTNESGELYGTLNYAEMSGVHGFATAGTPNSSRADGAR